VPVERAGAHGARRELEDRRVLGLDVVGRRGDVLFKVFVAQPEAPVRIHGADAIEAGDEETNFSPPVYTGVELAAAFERNRADNVALQRVARRLDALGENGFGLEAPGPEIRLGIGRMLEVPRILLSGAIRA